MQLNRLIYVAAVLLLTLAYLFFLRGDGYRLPVYYSGSGDIYFVNGPPLEQAPQKIETINRNSPLKAPSFFSSDAPVLLKTNKGEFSVRPARYDIFEIFLDLKFFIILSYIFLAAGIWFYESAKDAPLTAVCIMFSLFFFSLVVSLTTRRLCFFHIYSYFLLSPALFNMALRTTGKEIRPSLLLAELIVVFIIGFVLFFSPESTETIVFVRQLGLYGIYTTVFFMVVMQIENAVRIIEDPIEIKKRWVLVWGSAFGLFLPMLLFDSRYDWAPQGDPFPLIFSLFCFLPACMIYGTYRIQLVPFQLILTRSIVASVLTIGFVLFYAITLWFHNELLPEDDYRSEWLIHLLLLVIIMFFLDPARRGITAFLEKKFFRLDRKLTESLEELARLFAGPLNIQPTISAFLKNIKETLGTERAALLLSYDSFPDLHLSEDELLRLPEENPVWRHMKPAKLTVTSYLTYGGGAKSNLYRFLSRKRFYLAMGIHIPGDEPAPVRKKTDWLRFWRKNNESSQRAALLVGYKEKDLIFRLAEIRYLQEAGRLAGMLVSNYIILIQEVAKRKRMRELFLAGQVQRNLVHPSAENLRGIKFSYFNMPVISVTGDYLDIIKLSEEKFAFLLGDVSGHGLGTGYLVSAFRSMIRSHLESGADLAQTADTLNQFLLERYQGSEFITLFAMILDVDTGKMHYLNAAHPNPFIRKHGTGKLQRLGESQRLLGVAPFSYHIVSHELEPGDRLFLFSDGVTETFNEDEQTYGYSKLYEFLMRYGDEPLHRVTEKLKSNLQQFRGGDSLSDDTTFVSMEYDPGRVESGALISLLRRDRKDS